MRDWVHGVGHSTVCQILLQIVSSALVMAFPPACTSSAGTLSAPANFPFLSDFTSSRRMGYLLLEGRLILLGLLWLCSCTARSSTRTTSLGCPVLQSDIFHPCPVWWWFALALCWSGISPAGKFSCCYSSSCYLRCPGTALQSSSSLPFSCLFLFLGWLPYSFPIFLLLLH